MKRVQMEKAIKFLKNNVKYYRKRMDLTQQKLAEKCDVSTTYIAEIELGRKYPSLRTLIKISTVYNIPVHMLLIDPENNENQAIEIFSRDLETGIKKVIEDMKSRY